MINPSEHDEEEQDGLLLQPPPQQQQQQQQCQKRISSNPLLLDPSSWDKSIKSMINKYQSAFHSAVVFILIFGLLGGVFIWDLNQVHQISQIIHDDHSSLWERMNESAIKQWLTPLDQCLLKAGDPKTDLKKYRTTNCSRLATFSSSAQHRLFCTIGSSYGKQCTPPLSKHAFFYQRLRDKHFHDLSAKYLSKALRALAARHIPLIFIGDGLSKQNEDAVICDLLRTDRVSINGVVNTDPYRIITDYVIKWKDYVNANGSHLQLEVKYFPLNYIEGDKDDENVHIINLRRNKKRSRRRKMIPVWTPRNAPLVASGSTGKGRSSTDGASNISFYDGSSPQHSKDIYLIDYHITNVENTTDSKTPPVEPLKSVANLTSLSVTHGLSVIQDVITAILARNHSVAIIANAGVWYNSRERFRNELPGFLGWLNDLSRDSGNVILYRETAAQHWNHTSHGYYDSEHRTEKASNGTCVPIADATPELDWRNVDVMNIIENDKLQHLRVIPFHKYTMPLYNMHPNAAGAEDCTHYCYFPQMWQPVWYALYNATLSTLS